MLMYEAGREVEDKRTAETDILLDFVTRKQDVPDMLEQIQHQLTVPATCIMLERKEVHQLEGHEEAQRWNR